MPAGTIMTGKPNKHDILKNLDRAFKRPGKFLEAIADLDSPMFLANIADKHAVAVGSHYEHLRDDWFGADEKGGRFWPGAPGQPLAPQVRDCLKEILTRLTEIKPRKRAYAYWVEIPKNKECLVSVVEGDDEIVLIITTPCAPRDLAALRQARKQVQRSAPQKPERAVGRGLQKKSAR